MVNNKIVNINYWIRCIQRSYATYWKWHKLLL